MGSAQSDLRSKLLFLAVCAYVLLFSATHVHGQSKAITISGTVKDAVTKAPLWGVAVYPANIKKPESTGSDSLGSYTITIPNSKNDTVILTFAYLGYGVVFDTLFTKGQITIQHDKELEEVYVLIGPTDITAYKTPEQGSEGQSLAIIPQEQIDQQAATNLKPGLQMVTGLTIIDNQINIRGSSGFNYGTGSRVLVLLNGMPAMNTSRATVNFNLLPADNIERVEVIKGCAALRYGSGAMGGVVNVLMDKPADTSRTIMRFAQRFYLPPGERVKNWDGTKNSFVTSFHFSQSKRIREQYYVTVQADVVRDAGYRNREYNNRTRVLWMNEWRDAFRKQGLTLGLNLQYLWEKSAVFVFWKDYPYYTHEPGLNSLSEQTLNYFIADPSLKYISYKKNVYNYQGRISYDKTVSSTGLSGWSLQTWNELTWNRQLTPWLHALAGGNYQYSQSRPSNAQGNAEAHQSAAFAIGTLRFIKSGYDSLDYKLTITGGLRYQYERMTGDTLQTDNAYQSVGLNTMHHPLAGITVNYQLLRFTRVRASISQGVRAASINERFANISLGGLRTNPAPTINPETGYSAEVAFTQYFGYKAEKSKLSGYVDVAGFLMRFHDMIEFLIDIPKSSLTNLSFKAQNLTNVSIYGVEANLGLKYEYKKWQFAYNGGITALQAVNYDGLKELDGDSATVLVLNPPVPLGHPDFYKYIRDIPYTLKYRSKLTATQSLSISYGIFSFTTNYRYLSRMINVDKLLLFAIPGTYDFRNDHLDGWHLLDFIVSCTINKQHTISAHLFNALNSEYMILPGNIGEQRSVAMQYKVSF